MSLFDNLTRDRRSTDPTATPTPDTDTDDTDTEPVARPAGARTFGGTTRANEIAIGGETYTVEEPDTSQTDDDRGSWFSSGGAYGVPRGREALDARRISETSAMQAIINGIVDQVTGGDLAFESDGDDELPDAVADLQGLLRDVLSGPHLKGWTLDDLLTAAVADMVGPGNAYWQLLPDESGDIPVVSLVALDPLTVRHNINKHGVQQEPAYYQALSLGNSGGLGSIGAAKTTALTDDELAVMHYPKGARSNRVYPTSPALQVREWLEILVNSTKHHDRYYDDNKVPPGLIQVLNASGETIDSVTEKIEASKGDPRSAPIIGGEGQAMWVEMGGTAVNLDVIQEQEWFFKLCLASVGLGKQELGFIEDVNRSNGEVESSRVYKRVTGPFAKQFEEAFRKVANRFDVYREAGRPFDVTLRFTDPREERAREQRLREMYQAGGLTLRQYIRRRGDADAGDQDLSVEINGEVIEYGDHPKHVVNQLLAEASADPDATPTDGEPQDPDAPAGGE